MVAVDESFKKPGAIPFKWEIQPGVPKYHQPQPCISTPSTPQNPTPPPPPPPLVLRSSSLRSISTLHSDCQEHDSPLLTQPELVSRGCFRVAPWFRRKWWHKRVVCKPKELSGTSKVEKLAWWSMSTQKLASPLWKSTSSSSFSSHSSCPRPVSDAECTKLGDF